MSHVRVEEVQEYNIPWIDIITILCVSILIILKLRS